MPTAIFHWFWAKWSKEKDVLHGRSRLLCRLYTAHSMLEDKMCVFVLLIWFFSFESLSTICCLLKHLFKLNISCLGLLVYFILSFLLFTAALQVCDDVLMYESSYSVVYAAICTWKNKPLFMKKTPLVLVFLMSHRHSSILIVHFNFVGYRSEKKKRASLCHSTTAWFPHYIGKRYNNKCSNSSLCSQKDMVTFNLFFFSLSQWVTTTNILVAINISLH